MFKIITTKIMDEKDVLEENKYLVLYISIVKYLPLVFCN